MEIGQDKNSVFEAEKDYIGLGTEGPEIVAGRAGDGGVTPRLMAEGMKETPRAWNREMVRFFL